MKTPLVSTLLITSLHNKVNALVKFFALLFVETKASFVDSLIIGLWKLSWENCLSLSKREGKKVLFTKMNLSWAFDESFLRIVEKKKSLCSNNFYSKITKKKSFSTLGKLSSFCLVNGIETFQFLRSLMQCNEFFHFFA